MNEIEVIDNFLSEEIFERLEVIFDPGVPWTFSEILPDYQLICDQKYNYQYVHSIYVKQEPVSRFFDNMIPFLTKLDARALVRCKVNSICREEIGRAHVRTPVTS